MASKSSTPALALGPSTLDVAFDAGTLGLQLKRLRSSDPLATGTALIPCYAFINDVVKGERGEYIYTYNVTREASSVSSVCSVVELPKTYCTFSNATSPITTKAPRATREVR